MFRCAAWLSIPRIPVGFTPVPKSASLQVRTAAQPGRFRTTDNDLPQCEISGDGTIDGAAFNGPAGLSDLLAEQGLLDSCIVYQVYEFAMGHGIAEDDERYVEDLVTNFGESNYRFDELMLNLVSDEAFLYRREEEG